MEKQKFRGDAFPSVWLKLVKHSVHNNPAASLCWWMISADF